VNLHGAADAVHSDSDRAAPIDPQDPAAPVGPTGSDGSPFSAILFYFLSFRSLGSDGSHFLQLDLTFFRFSPHFVFFGRRRFESADRTALEGCDVSQIHFAASSFIFYSFSFSSREYLMCVFFANRRMPRDVSRPMLTFSK
jgi:hypothetical protein